MKIIKCPNCGGNDILSITLTKKTEKIKKDADPSNPIFEFAMCETESIEYKCETCGHNSDYLWVFIEISKS